MATPLRAVSVDYILDIQSHQQPDYHNHRSKLIAALEHIQGLGKILQAVDYETKGVSADLVAERLDSLCTGLHPVGEMIEIFSDAALTELEMLHEQTRAMIGHLSRKTGKKKGKS